MEILSDSEKNQLYSTHWDPVQWISCGKEYTNISPFVATARRILLESPAHVAHKLPSKTMSISHLLQCDTPPRSNGVDTMDVDFEQFSASEPTMNIEDILPLGGEGRGTARQTRT
ncbi:hypothetical protein B0H17DRAFT_1136627 [Mycena rosella]|uniref:Uncharacterized protein n=1 Tax=Mycena rosella TaxID=1033263 RepID=A0AAD7DAU8_MYCRO|nr:hypothetical protein B0H17DRAFT_1136627 [Mycena rosella]